MRRSDELECGEGETELGSLAVGARAPALARGGRRAAGFEVTKCDLKARSRGAPLRPAAGFAKVRNLRIEWP
jgi:hypothetical protein